MDQNTRYFNTAHELLAGWEMDQNLSMWSEEKGQGRITAVTEIAKVLKRLDDLERKVEELSKKD